MSTCLASPLQGLSISGLRDGDTWTVQHVFAGLSLASAFARFGTGMTRLPPRSARALATITPGRQQVLVARLAGRPIGLARWTRRDLGPAEVALEVADAWHGAGVGRALLASLVRDAAHAGVPHLHAYVVPGNERVLAWLARLGARRLGPEDGYVLGVEELLAQGPP
ncbi:GNAT family N-acetyltransferase [Nocardioides sp. SR21]|uniref:GNAT family N-acetyltransferase n=1 Tax=Nocardioides sp. SR21 TaxID=2919501 RepID=UPI001FAA40C1|nr:GNAT family N-acetyltransferase [Nocardioides sp. SR21]